MLIHALVDGKDETSHLYWESDSDSRPSPDDSDSFHDSKSHDSTRGFTMAKIDWILHHLSHFEHP